MRSVGTVVAVAAMTCGELAADDIWETSPSFLTDDQAVTPNQLIHGALQTHDIQGTASPAPTDQDFSSVRARARHSYEVRVFSTNTCFQANTTVSKTPTAMTTQRMNSCGTRRDRCAPQKPPIRQPAIIANVCGQLTAP